MPSESIKVSGLIPATPKTVYEAWLDAEQHSKFTGGKATVDPKVGGKFTAWGDYITGKTLELEPNRRIVQSWRTTEFEQTDPDSRLEVVLHSRGGGESEIVFLHTNLPEGQGHKYEMGWVDHYLTPMRAYFNKLKAKKEAALAKAAAAKAAGITAPAKAPAKAAAAKAAKPAKAAAPEKPAKAAAPAKAAKAAAPEKPAKAAKAAAPAKAAKSAAPAKPAKGAKVVPLRAKASVKLKAKAKALKKAGATKKAAAKATKAVAGKKKGVKKSRGR